MIVWCAVKAGEDGWPGVDVSGNGGGRAQEQRAVLEDLAHRGASASRDVVADVRLLALRAARASLLVEEHHVHDDDDDVEHDDDGNVNDEHAAE